MKLSGAALFGVQSTVPAISGNGRYVLFSSRTHAAEIVTHTNDAGQPVSLYIGYYASQRQGDTIHSPQNCLPGAGWQPIEGGPAPLDVASGRIVVNRYVIQKGSERQVVLYWYQGRGRVVANEFANRFWLMFDAAVRHRSNGALVRVAAPVRSPVGPVTVADAAATDFTRALFPRLATTLP